MAHAQAFGADVFEDDDGNLFVFRDGEFQPTTEQALTAGGVEAFAQGAGQTIKNIGRGAAGFITQDPEFAAQTAADEALLAPLAAERPFSTGAGRVAPFVAAAPLGGASLTGQVAVEAALGFAEGGPESAAVGAAAAAVPFGVGKMAQRVLGARRASGLGAEVVETADEATKLLEAGRPRAPGARAPAPAPAPRAPRTPQERGAQAFDQIDAVRGPPGSAGAGKTAIHSLRVSEAEEVGFKLTGGERANSDTMRQWEAGFRSNPNAPASFRQVKADNQVVLNQKWGEAIGVGPVEQITDDVMGQAVERASGEFARAARLAEVENPLGIETGGIGEILGNLGDVRGVSAIRDVEAQKLLNQVEEFVVRGRMETLDYMATRSDINETMRSAARQGEGLLTQAAQDVLDAMDANFVNHAGAEAAGVYQGARENWRFITALERGNTLNPATGNVNARTAGGSLRRIFKHEAGRGNIEGISDAGVETIQTTKVANYFADIVGDSGTATRSAINELVQNPAGAIVRGATTRALGLAYEKIIGPVLERSARGAPPPATGGLGGMGGLGGGGTPGPLPLVPP